MLTEEQHRIRATGIGSSEIAAICGESPYDTAAAVWLRKVGLEERDSVQTDATWLGHTMEPHLAARYTVETGHAVRPGPGTVRHPDHPWALCSTDYEHADGSRVVECKVVGWRVEHHWDDTRNDGIPSYVQAQAQWQMGIRGIREFAVPVLFTSDARFRVFVAAFDERVWNGLLEIGRRFWHDHVMAQVPPQADGSEDSRRMLTTLYPRPMRELAAAPPGSFEAALAYTDAGETEKAAKAAKALAGNRLREAIQDAEGIVGNWGTATWTSDRNGKRTLRVRLRKEMAA